MFTVAVQRSCGALWPFSPDIPGTIINWISKHVPEKECSLFSLSFFPPFSCVNKNSASHPFVV